MATAIPAAGLTKEIGVQFATLFCPPNMFPNFVAENSSTEITLCFGETIYDTIVATDPDPDDTLTLAQISGPGMFTSTPFDHAGGGIF